MICRVARRAAWALATLAMPALAGIVQGTITGVAPQLTTLALEREDHKVPGATIQVKEGKYSVFLEPGRYTVQLPCPDQAHLKTVTIFALDGPVVRNLSC